MSIHDKFESNDITQMDIKETIPFISVIPENIIDFSLSLNIKDNDDQTGCDMDFQHENPDEHKQSILEQDKEEYNLQDISENSTSITAIPDTQIEISRAFSNTQDNSNSRNHHAIIDSRQKELKEKEQETLDDSNVQNLSILENDTSIPVISENNAESSSSIQVDYDSINLDSQHEEQIPKQDKDEEAQILNPIKDVQGHSFNNVMIEMNSKISFYI